MQWQSALTESVHPSDYNDNILLETYCIDGCATVLDLECNAETRPSRHVGTWVKNEYWDELMEYRFAIICLHFEKLETGHPRLRFVDKC